MKGCTQTHSNHCILGNNLGHSIPDHWMTILDCDNHLFTPFLTHFIHTNNTQEFSSLVFLLGFFFFSFSSSYVFELHSVKWCMCKFWDYNSDFTFIVISQFSFFQGLVWTGKVTHVNGIFKLPWLIYCWELFTLILGIILDSYFWLIYHLQMSSQSHINSCTYCIK